MVTKLINPVRQPRRYALFGLLATAALLLAGCGGSDYDSSPPAGNPGVMIDAETLHNWAENGYGTDTLGYDKLVILDVDSVSGYEAGHIPGAQHLDTGTDLHTERSNGVSYTPRQVPTAAMMNDLMQRTGIDERTVIALVGDGNMMSVGRAYFNFRYWGFPKERLRVLNGTKSATYEGAGFQLATNSPEAEPSTYNVANLEANIHLRAPLDEMIAVAENGSEQTVILDARSEGEYSGEDIRAAFGGRVRGAQLQEWSTLLDPDNPTAMLPKGDLQSMMEQAGAGPDTTAYTYCQTSWRAAVNFMALDAVLDWPVKIYDGAWVQWGMMAGNDLNYGGALSKDSPWRTDVTTRSEAINYENTIVRPEPVVDSFADNANRINEEDKVACADTVPEDLSGLGPEPDSVMIEAAELAGWVDSGAPDGTGYSNLVVLHVDSESGYEEGHIPGAFLLDRGTAPNGDLSATRDNGITETISQVPTRDQMNDLIQRTGIDADTVVVFTSDNAMLLGRAYFNFRYWGFPKERLRVLDGNTGHYAEATGDELSTTTPAEVSSDYTVCNLPQQESVDNYRASFEELFYVARDGEYPAGNPVDAVIIDARSAGEYDGDHARTRTSEPGTYVAFEGHVTGAEHQEWTELLRDDGSGRLLPEAELQTAMNDIGADENTTGYAYCRTSWRAGVNFLALDAALGWPAKIYDGAWIQWGQMASDDSLYDGSLNPASPWRTDRDQLSANLAFNKTDEIDYLGANSYAPSANLINQEDASISGVECCVEDPVVDDPDGIAPTAPGYR